MKKTAVSALSLLLLQGAAFQGAAFADDFPRKPIEMIIPFDAGGNTDLMARAIQQPMAASLGQPLIPLNKPGASATLGTGETARAKPDGYTIAMVPLGPITIQLSLRKLPYSSDSFDYVCQTYNVPNFLMVSKS